MKYLELYQNIRKNLFTEQFPMAFLVFYYLMFSTLKLLRYWSSWCYLCNFVLIVYCDVNVSFLHASIIHMLRLLIHTVSTVLCWWTTIDTFWKSKEYFRNSRWQVFLIKGVALQHYWNHTSALVFSCKFSAYFKNTFY